jgi:hypothetical protein
VRQERLAEATRRSRELRSIHLFRRHAHANDSEAATHVEHLAVQFACARATADGFERMDIANLGRFTSGRTSAP